MHSAAYATERPYRVYEITGTNMLDVTSWWYEPRWNFRSLLRQWYQADQNLALWESGQITEKPVTETSNQRVSTHWSQDSRYEVSRDRSFIKALKSPRETSRNVDMSSWSSLCFNNDRGVGSSIIRIIDKFSNRAQRRDIRDRWCFLRRTKTKISWDRRIIKTSNSYSRISSLYLWAIQVHHALLTEKALLVHGLPWLVLVAMFC